MSEDATTPERHPIPLDELVRAIETTRKELSYQLMRLDAHVSPRTEEEAEYHHKLREGYAAAVYWIGILERYHRGRLARERGVSFEDV